MAMIAVMCYESIGAEQQDADTAVNNEIMPTPECLYEVISLRYIYYKGLNLYIYIYVYVYIYIYIIKA